MKKTLTILPLLIFLLCLTSCEHVTFDKSDLTEKENGFELNFHVGNVDTRGVVDAAKVCTKINFAVYDSIGNRVKAINQSLDDNAFGTIHVCLPEGIYKIVALAHNGDANASTTNMNKITFNGKVTDTFFYSNDIDVKENSDYQMMLKRCVAKVLFTIEDKVPENVKFVNFFYTGGSSSIDGIDGCGCVNSRQTELREVTNEAHAGSSAYELYTFPQTQKSMLNITVTCLDGNGNSVYERTFDNVNISRCSITTCKGKMFSGDTSSLSKDFTLKVDDEWGTGEIYNY
jgi:hypothetical protein